MLSHRRLLALDNAITDVIFRLSPDKVEAVGLIRWAGQRVGIAAITQYRKSAFFGKKVPMRLRY